MGAIHSSGMGTDATIEVRVRGDLICWFDGSECIETEHRSQGPTVIEIGEVIVRGPRDEDPVHVVLCGHYNCRSKARQFGSHLGQRPAIVSVHRDRGPARTAAYWHSESHRTVHAPFRRRRRAAYERQRNIEAVIGAPDL